MKRALVVLGLLGGVAHADSRAEAVVLFDQGIKDMKAGKLDKACPELQASLDLVKDSGTKGALARCHGLAGRVASAWLLWRELADTAPTAALRTDAGAQAAKLEPRLPRYTITVARAVPGLAVQINGRDVASHVTLPVPIDPGTVSVSAVGKDGERETTRRWSHDYTAAEGQTLTIEIPALAPVAAPVVTGPVAVVPPPVAQDDELASRRHRRHVVATVIGVVALGLAGGSTYFGLQARSRYDDAKQTCGGAIDDCAPENLGAAQKQVDDARSAATLSTIGFGVAGAAAITAIVVWATAPSRERKDVALAPMMSRDAAGFVLAGRF